MEPSATIARAFAAAGIGACVLALSGSASAYTVKHAASGAIVRWATDEVSFVVSPTIDRAAPGGRDAVRRASGAWSALGPNVPSIVLRDGNGGEHPAYDGRNVIYFAESGYPRAGRALAITILTFDSQSGAIVDCDIVVNGPRAFVVLSDDAHAPSGARSVATEDGAGDDDEGQRFDLVHVLAHEMGHALGLGDEANDARALMYPFTMPGDASMRAPRNDDANGLAIIYATPAAPESSSGGSPNAHSGCALGARPPRGEWPLCTAALALMFVRRRERR